MSCSAILEVHSIHHRTLGMQSISNSVSVTQLTFSDEKERQKFKQNMIENENVGDCRVIRILHII